MGLVAIVYAGIGGLVGGIFLAIVIGEVRKFINPESSFWGTFFSAVFLTVPVSAIAVFVYMLNWAQKNF